MTLILRLISIILLPWIVAFFALRHKLRLRLFAFAGIFSVQLFSVAPIAYIAISAYSEYQISNNAGSIYPNYTIVNSELHGASTFLGIDISRSCGSAIYAPFAGTVTENHIDHQGNTILTIVSGDYELTLAHGDYLPEIDSQVRQGQMIGTENTHGHADGCHSHVILKQNGRFLNYLDWEKTNQMQVANASLADVKPLLLSAKSDYPLRISWYDPSLGGTNCDGDCTTMASGDKVQSWIGGRGGIFAAACPRSNGWHHGLRFEIDGVTYECRDTGGWINCYQPGQIDLAIQNAHSRGRLLDVPAMAEISYCWVDLLNGSQYQYGLLAYNWSFIQ